MVCQYKGIFRGCILDVYDRGVVPMHGRHSLDYRLCKEEVMQMHRKMVGVPIIYHHDEAKDNRGAPIQLGVIGRIIQSIPDVTPEGRWDIIFELGSNCPSRSVQAMDQGIGDGPDTLASITPAIVMNYVRRGITRSLSLGHQPGIPSRGIDAFPREVSICEKGMRNMTTNSVVDVSDRYTVPGCHCNPPQTVRAAKTSEMAVNNYKPRSVVAHTNSQRTPCVIMSSDPSPQQQMQQPEPVQSEQQQNQEPNQQQQQQQQQLGQQSNQQQQQQQSEQQKDASSSSSESLENKRMSMVQQLAAAMREADSMPAGPEKDQKQMDVKKAALLKLVQLDKELHMTKADQRAVKDRIMSWIDHGTKNNSGGRSFGPAMMSSIKATAEKSLDSVAAVYEEIAGLAVQNAPPGCNVNAAQNPTQQQQQMSRPVPIPVPAQKEERNYYQDVLDQEPPRQWMNSTGHAGSSSSSSSMAAHAPYNFNGSAPNYTQPTNASYEVQELEDFDFSMGDYSGSKRKSEGFDEDQRVATKYARGY